MASATSNNSSSSDNPTVSQSGRTIRMTSSPWTQIVRGESEPTIAVVSSSPIEPIASVSIALPPASSSTMDTAPEESGIQGNAGTKRVWKTPSNASSSEIGPVMGASSWPALTETTKAPSNKSSSDSLKSLGDLPSSVSQGIANVTAPATKQIGRVNPNSTLNHSRQRSFNKRNVVSGSVTANGIVSQGLFAELPSHNTSPRGLNQNQKNGTIGGTGDSYKNQNGNHHHHNHGVRRNQDQNWSFQRSFNVRDGNVQSSRGPSFARHPPPPPVLPIPHFMPPAPPFATPLPFPPELVSPYYHPRMPFITPIPPAPVFYHVQDVPLNIKLQKQIHYYFSEENLVSDTYLRGLMDDEGFAPLRVIAGFKKVAELTDSIQQIVEALQDSPFVEVQGERIRKRHNWQQWLLPKVIKPAISSIGYVDSVSNRVGNMSLGQSSVDSVDGSSSWLQPENKAVSDGQQHSSPNGSY